MSDLCGPAVVVAGPVSYEDRLGMYSCAWLYFVDEDAMMWV